MSVADNAMVECVRWITWPRKRLASRQRILKLALAARALDQEAEAAIVGGLSDVEEADQLEVEVDERIVGAEGARLAPLLELRDERLVERGPQQMERPRAAASPRPRRPRSSLRRTRCRRSRSIELAQARRQPVDPRAQRGPPDPKSVEHLAHALEP